jgi:RNA polymerase sigma-70 factor (ECF subfamily)
MAVPRRRPEELSDEELVALCRENDHDAFTELVDRYKNGIHWLVKRMVGSSEHEDLTQEVFLRVYRAIPSFRGESTFKTWVFRIARNLCLSELRKAGRRGEHVSLDEKGEEKIRDLLPESGSDAEKLLERRELSRHVRQLVGELPLQYRTVLTLFYVNRIRYEDIAEIMEIPLGTVKTHLHRARMRLRNLVLDSSKVAGLTQISGDPASADEVKP